MDREARLEAAREAVRGARSEAARPWWQRRFFGWLTALPRRFWRGLKWWGREAGEGAYEVLLVWVALLVGFVLFVLWAALSGFIERLL